MILLLLLFLFWGGVAAFSSSPLRRMDRRAVTTLPCVDGSKQTVGSGSAQQQRLKRAAVTAFTAASLLTQSPFLPPAHADETPSTITVVEEAAAAPTLVAAVDTTDYGAFKVPYNHENVPLRRFLGNKATILYNIKIDDSQTPTQWPAMAEVCKTYADKGLSCVAVPTDQGWFEPDDDETVREKARVYYKFGNPPVDTVIDKVDVLGPSAHPLYIALTKGLPTPNGYSRITLNYEKFLLDAEGRPVRRYPRKYTAYDMETDVQALLAGEALPDPSEAWAKAWREAKREAVKSEYAFRFNYNYYDAPDSMYKYDSKKDVM